MRHVALGGGAPVSRVIRGNWQLAGGHGRIERERAIDDMIAFADAGITTFDCADIYTGVEELIGAFRERYRNERGAEALSRVRVHTKFVPDLGALGSLARTEVAAAIDRSRAKLGVEAIDLVQFHWWDYGEPRWREVAGWLAGLVADGRIRNLGGTNFDAERTAAMIDDGAPLVAMQVQYSLLDDRPGRAMADLAARSGMALLCYGSVAGGFLSDRWLGRTEPDGPLENRSLTKYKLIIDDCGGWDAYQHLLGALRGIADRHGTDIATVSSAWTLTRPHVAAAIVGARNADHLASNLAVASLELSPDDLDAIEAARAGLAPLEGDVYALERDRTGPHGSVMKYNLNKDAA